MLRARCTLDLSGYRVLRARTINALDNAAEDAANDGAEAARAAAKATTKFRDRSGQLRGSIGAVPARPSGRRFWDALVQATARHAAHVEWGTRPHPIVAKAARGFIGPVEPGQSRSRRKQVRGLLVFYWAKLGRWVAFKKVRHPGTHPTWFMSLAARKGYYAMIDSAKRAEERIAAIWR
jgi:hypothetical protein